MKTFDFNRMALDKFPIEFLAEVGIRFIHLCIGLFISQTEWSPRRAADVAI